MILLSCTNIWNNIPDAQDAYGFQSRQVPQGSEQPFALDWVRKVQMWICFNLTLHLEIGTLGLETR